MELSKLSQYALANMEAADSGSLPPPGAVMNLDGPVIFTVEGEYFQDDALIVPCSDTCAKNIPKWSKRLDSLIGNLNKSAAFKSQFSTATSDAERVRLCFAQEDTNNQLNKHVTVCKISLTEGCRCHKKDETKAKYLHDLLGFASDDTMIASLKVFKGLTYALMFAPDDGEEAARMYDIRSAASFALKQHENALQDIERAIARGGAQLDQPPKQITSLLSRKAGCLIMLGRREEAALVLNDDQPGAPQAGTPEGDYWSLLKSLLETTLPLTTVDLSKYHDSTTVINALVAKGKFISHGRFPWLNAKLTLRYDDEKGYHLVPKKKLDYGEIISIGSPFAGLATLMVVTQYDRCHFCFTHFPKTPYTGDVPKEGPDAEALKIQEMSSGPIRMSVPLPCTVCPNAIYCSEACRTEAWHLYHRYECNQLHALTKLDHAAHLALRMLYSAGSLERIKQVVHDWETIEDKLEFAKDPRDYAFIYSMRQPEIRDVEDELSKTVTACFLAKLAQLSGFVSGSAEDEEFAASILLRHLLQLKANVYTPTQVHTEYSDELCEASSVNGIINTMTFSCEPNVGCSSIFEPGIMSSNVRIFYAARAIKKGGQLSMCYDTPLTGDFLMSQFDHTHTLLMSFSACPCGHTTEKMLQHLNKTGAERTAAITKLFGRICKCSRCEREKRDSLDLQRGVYFPIACPACRSLMVRPEEYTSPDAGYRCSLKSCRKTMSNREMKAAYQEISKFTDLIFPRLCAANKRKPECKSEVNKFTNKLQTDLARVTSLLYPVSDYLVQVYLRASVLCYAKGGSRKETLNSTLLTHSSLYAEKALAICEKLYDGPGFDNALIRNCLAISDGTVDAGVNLHCDELDKECKGKNEEYCVIKQRYSAQKRFERAKKLTAYDQMLTCGV